MNGKQIARSVPPGPGLPPLRPKGARLLALDGGGVKGVSSVLILDAIMDRVRTIEQKNKINTSTDPRKPCDYFDLGAGTSTGGLIALMLFRLRMDTTQCLTVYRSLGKDIFAPTLFGSRALGSIFGKAALAWNMIWKGSQFGKKPLEKAIERVVNQYSAANDPWRSYLVNPTSGMMFMCATLENKGESILLRSYIRPPDAAPRTHAARDDDLVNGIDIVSAARATSAAPMYLPPEEWPPNDPVKTLRFWDGGVLNNNPIDQLWSARYDLVGQKQPPPAVNVVLSVGCSWSSATKPKLLVRVLNTLNKYTEKYIANTEAKHRDFYRLVNRMRGRGDQTNDLHYYRLNCPTFEEQFDMADYTIMPKLEELTRNYISRPDTARELEEIAQLLASRE